MNRDEPESVRKARAQGRAGMPPQAGWEHGSEEMRAWVQGRKEWGKTMMRMDQKIDKVIDTLLEQDNQVKTLVAGRGQKFYNEEAKRGGWDGVEDMADDLRVFIDNLLGFWLISPEDFTGPSVEELLDKGSFVKPEEIEVNSIVGGRLYVHTVNAYVFDNVAYIIPEDPKTGKSIDVGYFF